jgi:acyl carrier protein
MERKEVEKVVKETIFEKMGKFNGLDHAAQIMNEDKLDTDMTMDSLDFVEVIMEVEKKTGKCIPDEALNVKPYHELTVGELMDMLYDYLNMISVKELRPGNLVKDKAGDIWRVGCVTGMRNESGSLILEREVDDGIMKWYSGEDDVMPIEIDDNLLDAIGFKSDKNRDVYRGYGMTMEVFGDEYYLGLRDMEGDLSELIQIRYLHNLQNISMDLYGRDINTERLYDRSGE